MYVYVYNETLIKTICGYYGFLVKCTMSKQGCAQSCNKDGACSILIRKKVINELHSNVRTERRDMIYVYI